MRIPLPLAWILLISTFGTAALLRTFHVRTPVSPLISPIVGSALFAALLVLGNVVVSVLIVSMSRYRYPMMLLVVPFAVDGALQLRQSAGERTELAEPGGRIAGRHAGGQELQSVETLAIRP